MEGHSHPSAGYKPAPPIPPPSPRSEGRERSSRCLGDQLQRATARWFFPLDLVPRQRLARPDRGGGEGDARCCPPCFGATHLQDLRTEMLDSSHRIG